MTGLVGLIRGYRWARAIDGLLSRGATAANQQLRFMVLAFAVLTAGLGEVEAKAEPVLPIERAAAEQHASSDESPQARLILQNKMSSGKMVAFTHDDRFLVVSDPALGIGIEIWEVETGRFVNSIDFPTVDRASIKLLNFTVDGNHTFSAVAEVALDGGDLCKTARLTISLARASKWEVATDEGLSPCAGPNAVGTGGSSYEGEMVRSHNGRYRVKGDRVFIPLVLEDSEGVPIRNLEGARGSRLVGAGVSPDGSLLAVLLIDLNIRSETTSTVAIFDLLRSRIINTFEVPGKYQKILWTNSITLLLPGAVTDYLDESTKALNKRTSPTRVFGAFDGKEVETPIPFRCGFLVVPGVGLVVGSGLGNCTPPGADGEGLEQFQPDAGWTKFGPRYRGSRIRGFALTPDGRTLVAVATRDIRSRRKSGAGSAEPERLIVSVRAIDAASGKLLNEVKFPEPVPKDEFFGGIKTAPGSSSVTLRLGPNVYRWDTSASRPTFLGRTADLPKLEFQPETVRTNYGPPIETWRPFDEMDLSYDLGEGLLSGGPLRWKATPEAIEIWRPRTQDLVADAEVMRTYLFRRFHFTLAPDGRYDTNFPPDVELFNWQVSDAPLRLLGPQTFMRNLYEPQLSDRMIACQIAGDCATRFPPVTDIGKLNRVLPEVKILAVKAAAEPNQAIVEIEVRGGSVPDAPNGRTKTEAYNLRLFRDGALVAQYPKLDVDIDTTAIEAWRERNLIAPGPGGARKVTLTVALPTGTEAKDIRFTAYAFNEDRVKSETSYAEYNQPAVAKPRPRRAFIVTIGIDAYGEKGPSPLRYAVKDAELLGERLSRIPGYEVRRMTLAGRNDPGKRQPVTGIAIAHTIAILRGVNVAAARKALADMGFDASQLEPPTPDDIVILGFAGHGWADAGGAFYLVPSDAVWTEQGPDRTTLISAVQMADRLREVDAGEMAMIIDACHSAASVAAGGFKPGPMGDAGLGQLAFDKGIRILAATQADDVAYEDSTLRQGLLTYVLANEGITDTGGKADSNGDHRITLDEWLGYAVARMPALGEEIHLGRTTIDASGTRVRGWIPLKPATSRPKIQEPALFDFSARASGIVLREGVLP